MATMKAIRIHEFGGPEKLLYEDAPIPTPRPGEALLRVHAAGVNPVDWKVREGYTEKIWKHTLPLILGWDVSGVVESVGEGVTDVKVGDEVYADTEITRDGAYAEYVIVRASLLAPKPKSASHLEAASLPIAALTAYQALFEAAGLTAGQTVLIHAAAGGVGSLGVQMAKNIGARVIGTASARNHAFLKELGADELVDYNTVKFEEVVKNVDVVFDTMGKEIQARSWACLKPGGYLVGITSDVDEADAARRGFRGSHVMARSNAKDLITIADMVDAGKLKPLVTEVYPLAETRKAHEHMETGHTRGKIVLNVTG